MAPDFLSREVLIDVSVNFIPLSILVAFLVLFVVVAPWGVGFTLATAMQVALMVLPLVGLAVLTYVAAKKIETADGEFGRG